MRRILACLLCIFSFLTSALSPPSHRPAPNVSELITQWKAAYVNEWWLWGLNAIDYDGDGHDDLVLTQHNGGSRILRSNGDGTFAWAQVGSDLGGTYRPIVMRFGDDSLESLGFRDSGSNTFFRNTEGQLTPLGFAYGTSNDPIRDIADFNGDGNLDFGHDWARWIWSGNKFTYQEYTHPAYGLLPPQIKTLLNDGLGKPFFNAWFNQRPDMTIVSGFWSYHKNPPFCRFMHTRRGRLVDASALLGLPTTGAVCYADDFNGDGQADLFIVGCGYYRSGPNGYKRQDGALSDFLAKQKDWCHQVFSIDNMIAVNNVRGQATKIFQNDGKGVLTLIESIWSWDGEPVAIGDFNGDGNLDFAVGAMTGNGNDIVFVWGS